MNSSVVTKLRHSSDTKRIGTILRFTIYLVLYKPYPVLTSIAYRASVVFSYRSYRVTTHKSSSSSSSTPSSLPFVHVVHLRISVKTIRRPDWHRDGNPLPRKASNVQDTRAFQLYDRLLRAHALVVYILPLDSFGGTDRPCLALSVSPFLSRRPPLSSVSS